MSLRGLRRGFAEREVLRGVDLDLKPGGTALVVGPNGAGKTTLLRVLATLLRPGGGGVRVLGCELPAESWRLRGRIGYLGHEPLLYRDLTGRENLELQARLHGLARAETSVRIGEVLERTGMARRAGDRVGELSAGMRQRLAIARCALHRPELMLLDEPDSHLDAAGRAGALELVGPDSGATRVIVTHDPDRWRPETDHLLDLGNPQPQSPRA